MKSKCFLCAIIGLLDDTISHRRLIPAGLINMMRSRTEYSMSHVNIQALKSAGAPDDLEYSRLKEPMSSGSKLNKRRKKNNSWETPETPALRCCF